MKVAVAVIAYLCLMPQLGAQTAQDAWKKVLSRCAASAPLGTNLVFLGASNDVGPGSVWRVADKHSLRLVWELSDAVPDTEARNSFLKVNPSASCTGKSPSKWSLSLGLPFTSKISGIDASLTSDLSRAKSVTVSVDSWRLVELKEGPFKRLLESTIQNKDYVTDLKDKDHIFIEAAVQVTGFTTTFDFSSDYAATIKAKYSGNVVSTGDGGATLKGTWTSDKTLSLTATSPIYLTGNFAQWTGTAISGMEGDPVASAPVVIKGDVTLGTDRKVPH